MWGPGGDNLDSCSSFYCGPNNPVRWESLSPPLLVLHPQCLVSAVSVNMGGALQPPPEVKHWPESGGKDTWSGIGDGEE